MRLIDADKLIQLKCIEKCGKVADYCQCKCFDLDDIRNFPTADVKPIVYCKNCKFQDDIQGCIRLNIFVDKNTFYCEYAMRKESEE